MSRIFISYSHRGDGPKWKARLLQHLGVFEQHHLLDVWQDGKIRVSSFWNDDIKQGMSSARLAVVLLTKEALESEFILKTELPFLRERQQRDKLPVFPVICEECDWKAHVWLRATQAPNNSNPLSQLSDVAQDRIFRQLATEVAKELSRVALTAMSPLSPLGGERGGVRGEAIADVHTYLDKFPLTRSPSKREEKLIGREQELALLDLAFASSSSPSPLGGERVGVRGSIAIVSLVAWGGVGKTMLVQHWLQRLQREGWFGARRVYAWSFYSQGTKEDRQASEDTFLAHALEWFGVQCEPTLSPWDKGRLLADAVAREQTLLILDGIEPLQYPPGPMGGQLRAPGVQSLLKHLARKANSEVRSPKPEASNCLCLVTTREPLTDLADFQRCERSPWGSVLRVDLGNLAEEAGAALLHHAGAKRAGAAEIKPDDAELLAASREVDGHALTLNLLGRFLARAHSGDIRRRDLVKFEEADRKEQGATTFKMLTAFEKWFSKGGEFGARQLAVMRILGLFDRPADAACIDALREPPVIPGLTDPLFTTRVDAGAGEPTLQPLIDEDWRTATSFLEDFNLIVFQGADDHNQSLLGCHPLIREYFANQLGQIKPEAWTSAHHRLFKLLDQIAEPLPSSIESLQPLYQALAHGCQAGIGGAIWNEIYQNRIQRHNEGYSMNKLGAFGSDLAAFASFFEHPWDVFRPNLSLVARSDILYNVAICLRATGRWEEALCSARSALALSLESPLLALAASLQRFVCAMELGSGSVSASVDSSEKAVKLADASRSAYEQITALTTRGCALHQFGRTSQALEEFATAGRLLVQNRESLGPRWIELHLWHQFRLHECQLSGVEAEAWRMHLCPNPPSTYTSSSDFRMDSTFQRTLSPIPSSLVPAGPLYDALDRLTKATTYLYMALAEKARGEHVESLAIAEVEIGAAANGIHLGGRLDYLRLVFLPRSWIRFLRNDVDGACEDLDEAWDIAERGPMRLHLADIHLHRARLFFREKAYPWKSPQADLAAAEKLINDCGYHRRDEELADAKRAIFGP